MSGCEDDTKVSKFNHDGFNVYPTTLHSFFIVFIIIRTDKLCFCVCFFIYLCKSSKKPGE